MYCTTFLEPLSSQIGDEVRAAFGRFRRRARTLATISKSFDDLATSTTAAYWTALTEPSRPAWTTLVTRVALLARQTNALHGILTLDDAERDAVAFFEAIVRENADLLRLPEPFALPADRSAQSGSFRASAS